MRKPLVKCSVILAVVLEACSSYKLQVVNIDPLLRIDSEFVEGDVSLRGFDVVVESGLQKSDGTPRSDGVKSLVTRSFLSEDTSSRIDARVFTLAGLSEANALYEGSCESAESQFGSERVRRSGSSDRRYCATFAKRLRNDAEGGWIPSRFWFSMLWVQNGRLVVQLKETRKGSADSAKDDVIARIAAELSRPLDDSEEGR
jgi:hypothetical protein